MSTDAPATPPRKKRHLWRWVGLAVLLFVAWFCWQLFGPNPPIIVSRETTYITAPLGPDGLPDYEKYVLEKYREGVTPENNAAVLLMKVIGRGSLDTPDYEAISCELKLEEAHSADDVLVPLENRDLIRRLWVWLCEEHNETYGTYDPKSIDWYTVKKAIDRAASHPWRADEFQPLADWVSQNQKSLDEIVTASKRTRLYWPSPMLLNDRDDLLVEMNMPIANMRELVRALSVRAMGNVGEGRNEEAWQDIIAIFQLARITDQGPLLVDRLLSGLIVDRACEATLAILIGKQLDGKLANHIRDFLSTSEDYLPVTDTLNDGQRVLSLDAVLYMRSQGPDVADETDFLPIKSDSSWDSVDWTAVLKNINQEHDRLVAISRRSSWVVQQEEESAFSDKLYDSAMSAYENQQNSSLHGRFNLTQATSAIISNVLVRDYSRAVAAERRANTRMDLVRLAAALVAYQAEHREYPEKLEDLAPEFLGVLPNDRYYGKPYFYHRNPDGYLLYSAGRNGRDDGGCFRFHETMIFAGRDLEQMDYQEAAKLESQIPPEADDIAIRVPVPPFKLPEPSSR